MTSRRARKHLQPPRRPPTGPVPRWGTGCRRGAAGGRSFGSHSPAPPAAPPTGPVPDGGTGCRRGAARGRAFDWGFRLASRRLPSLGPLPPEARPRREQAVVAAKGDGWDAAAASMGRGGRSRKRRLNLSGSRLGRSLCRAQYHVPVRVVYGGSRSPPWDVRLSTPPPRRRFRRRDGRRVARRVPGTYRGAPVRRVRRPRPARIPA